MDTQIRDSSFSNERSTNLTYSCPNLDTIVGFPLGPPVSSLSTLIHSEKQKLRSLKKKTNKTTGCRKHQMFTPQLP